MSPFDSADFETIHPGIYVEREAGTVPRYLAANRAIEERGPIDPEALAAALEKIASDPARYAAMGTAAAQAVAERFEQGKQIEVLERCYTEALQT